MVYLNLTHFRRFSVPKNLAVQNADRKLNLYKIKNNLYKNLYKLNNDINIIRTHLTNLNLRSPHKKFYDSMISVSALPPLPP